MYYDRNITGYDSSWHLVAALLSVQLTTHCRTKPTCPSSSSMTSATTIRVAWVGTYYETPNIDRIAREGMIFTHGYAACQVCSPSRPAIMTGKAPARLGITDWIGQRLVRPGANTIATTSCCPPPMATTCRMLS